jgi:hypothetical protein
MTTKQSADAKETNNNFPWGIAILLPIFYSKDSSLSDTMAS